MTKEELDKISNAQKQKQSDDSTVGELVKLPIKIKKLKIAKKLAITKRQKEKLIDKANDIDNQINNKIVSLGLNKFVIGKTKRLKKMGKSKEEVQQIIKDLISETQNASINENIKASISSAFIDKKYLGLNADEILKKINAVTTKDTKQSNNKKEQIDINKLSDNINKNINDAVHKEMSKYDLDVTEQQTDQTTNEKRKYEKSGKYKGKNKKSLDDSNDDSNNTHATPNKTNKTDEKQETLKLGENSDTVTEEKIREDNEKIYDYLMKKGEIDIANRIDTLMNDEKKENLPKLSEIKENTKELKRLSSIQGKISESIEKLQEDLIDEQDTSVSIQKRLENEVQSKSQNDKTVKPKENKMGFLESLLRMLLGDTIVDFLIKAKDLSMLAIPLLTAGWKWLSNKFKDLFKVLIKPFSSIIDGIKVGLDWAKDKINSLSEVVYKLWDKVKSFLGDKLKSVKKFFGVDADKPKKISNNTKDQKTKMSDNVKDGEKAKKSGKAKIDEKNTSKKSKESKKSKKLSKSKISKIKPTGVLKKLLRFTKIIPFIGTAIAATTAIYSAQDGYRHADEILNKDKKSLTTTDKLASAAGALVNDVSFGVLSTKATAEKIIDITQSGESKEAVLKYEKDGIIDYNRLGDSDIKDWEMLQHLPSKEIQKIIDFDDWSDGDRDKLVMAYEISKEREKLSIDKSASEQPNKTQKDEQFNTKTESNEKSETDKKIDDINTNIDFLKNEQKKTSNKLKQANIDDIIRKKENEIQKLKELKKQNQTDGSLIKTNKDKQMLNVENTYSETLDNTKAYDNSVTNVIQTKQQQPNNISIVSPNDNSATVSSFNLFDNYL